MITFELVLVFYFYLFLFLFLQVVKCSYDKKKYYNFILSSFYIILLQIKRRHSNSLIDNYTCVCERQEILE
jgi:hypothetical protein